MIFSAGAILFFLGLFFYLRFGGGGTVIEGTAGIHWLICIKQGS